MADDILAAKRLLRQQMNEVRRAIASAPASGERSVAERSADVSVQLVAALAHRFDGVPGAVGSAPAAELDRPMLRRVFGYDAVAGEVDLGPLLDEFRSHGIEVAVPAAEPAAEYPKPPSWPDVILVPGLAFDESGGRLGRGGGWYDRLLGDVSRRGVAVGVGFDPQLVDSVPTEEHDVLLDAVVVEHRAVWRHRT